MDKENLDFAIENLVASFLIDGMFISPDVIEKVREKYKIKEKVFVKKVEVKDGEENK